MSEGEAADPLRAVWDQQSVWSQAADRLKTTVAQARAASLVSGIAAAVLGTAASQVMAWNGGFGKALAFGAAVAAGLVPVFTTRSGPQAVASWTRLRSVSEAIKNECYTYLAGVTPYRGAQAEAELLRRVEELRAEASDLLPHTMGLQATPRTPPAVTDVDSYIELRLKNQIEDYYRPKAVHMGRRVAAVRRTELLLGVAGTVLGALSGALGVESAAAWVAVLATIGSAVTVHALASKYQYQHMEFARTADELQRLTNRWAAERQTDPDAQREDDFVHSCERVISVLNDAWMVKWTTE
ncbi:DUF4231 domain-containing protein [Streptomyces sp. ODS28]|uniref:DUF4231 domain-containing protein n=1 Tax=Streptomyces sp. ODS28 TaxID=3136688 RepID=UPI0031EADAF6